MFYLHFPEVKFFCLPNGKKLGNMKYLKNDQNDQNDPDVEHVGHVISGLY